MGPGATSITRIPYLPASTAALWVSIAAAALLALKRLQPAKGVRAATEVTFTITPPVSRMLRNWCLRQKNDPFKFAWNISSNSASV